jgi:hypothetical protein
LPTICKNRDFASTSISHGDASAIFYIGRRQDERRNPRLTPDRVHAKDDFVCLTAGLDECATLGALKRERHRKDRL